MDYQELKNLVDFYLHRTDMVDKLDAFFELARERIGKDARLIRMQTEVELTVVDGSAPLPVDYLQVKAMSTGQWPIRFQDVNNFDRLKTATRGGNAPMYTIRAAQFHFAPTPGTARLTYYAKPAKLVDPGDTNTITDYYPTLYLYAALVYAHNAIQDLASEQVANANYQSELAKANESDAFGSAGSPSMSGI
jgi:hypothetical protein